MKALLDKYALYNRWANEKVISFLGSARESLLDKELVSSFPTIRKTVYHIWDAETIWLGRLEGNSFPSWPSKGFTGSFSDARDALLLNSQALAAFVALSDSEYLESMVTYHSMDKQEHTTQVSDALLHCMNHSTFHRGQLVSVLRNAGCTELGSTDYITYCRNH